MNTKKIKFDGGAVLMSKNGPYRWSCSIKKTEFHCSIPDHVDHDQAYWFGTPYTSLKYMASYRCVMLRTSVKPCT